MKVQSRKIKWLALGALLVAAVLVGSHLWVDAREKSGVDPGWKLAGRWAADGNRDKMLIGGPVSVIGPPINILSLFPSAAQRPANFQPVSTPDFSLVSHPSGR